MTACRLPWFCEDSPSWGERFHPVGLGRWPGGLRGTVPRFQYSGAGGRDPLFLADKYIPQIQEYVVPRLIGRKLTSFRALAEEIDGLPTERISRCTPPFATESPKLSSMPWPGVGSSPWQR